jgi:hypothetical protein
MATIETINYLEKYNHKWDYFHGNMWDPKYPDGYPAGSDPNYGWKYLTKADTNYNYVIHGPTGGGKTGFAVYLCMVNAVIRGIPVYSNVPFQYFVYDKTGKKYIVVSKEFDVVKFINGDFMYWGSWVLIDEGNFSMDQKKTMSNMNVSMTDIIQEGRKMGMNLVFTSINAQWLDPRFTGSLLDIAVKCKDLYFSPWGNEHQVGKGIISWWDFVDISGKYTGNQGMPIDSRAFFYREIWNTFNTQFFINPLEARKRLVYDKMKITIGADGQQIIQDNKWINSIKQQLIDLKQINGGIWSGRDLWETLGIKDLASRVTIGKAMRNWGVLKKGSRTGGDRYWLQEMVEA